MEIEVAIHGTLDRKARHMGLSVAQTAVAQDLANHPDSSLQEVYSRLGWPKSTVSRLVTELTEMKIVTRDISSKDKRTVILSLCPSTRKKCLSNVMTDFFPGSSGELSEKEAGEIASTLDRILYLMRN
jgi:DNA-binding MarR family transcriptional regulator